MKKIIYSLVIMIAAGSLFTSCVNYDEPVGVQDLREAKASYLDALSGLRAADAELQKAYAEVQKSIAAKNNADAEFRKAEVEHQKLVNAAKEISNATDKAQSDQKIAEAQKLAADAKAAAELAAKQHEYAMAQAQQSLENLKKKIASEALALTQDEQNAITWAIQALSTALTAYNGKVLALETAQKALFEAQNGKTIATGNDGLTAEEYKAAEEKKIADAKAEIAKLNERKEALSSDPDVEKWQAYLKGLNDEHAENAYEWNKNAAGIQILKSTTLYDAKDAAEKAWKAWKEEHEPDAAAAQTVTYKPDMPEIQNNSLWFATSMENWIKDALGYNGQWNWQLNGSTTEYVNKVLNGWDEEQYPLATNIQKLGFKGVIKTIEDSKILEQDTTTVPALKEIYEKADSTYKADLATIKAGRKAFIDNDTAVQHAIADTVAKAAALAAENDTLTSAKAALKDVKKADSTKAANLFAARKALAQAAKAIQDEGLATATSYSTADVDSVLKAIKDFVAAKQEVFGAKANDTLKYYELVGSSVEEKSLAIKDLTRADLAQTIDSVAYASGAYHFAVHNTFTHIVKKGNALDGYAYNSYEVQTVVTTSGTDAAWSGYNSLSSGFTSAQVSSIVLSKPAAHEVADEVFSVIFKALGLVPNFWATSGTPWYDDVIAADATHTAADRLFNFGNETEFIGLTYYPGYEDSFGIFTETTLGQAQKYNFADYAAALDAKDKAQADVNTAQTAFTNSKATLKTKEFNAFDKFCKIINKFYGINTYQAVSEAHYDANIKPTLTQFDATVKADIEKFEYCVEKLNPYVEYNINGAAVVDGEQEVVTSLIEHYKFNNPGELDVFVFNANNTEYAKAKAADFKYKIVADQKDAVEYFAAVKAWVAGLEEVLAEAIAANKEYDEAVAAYKEAAFGIDEAQSTETNTVYFPEYFVAGYNPETTAPKAGEQKAIYDEYLAEVVKQIKDLEEDNNVLVQRNAALGQLIDAVQPVLAAALAVYNNEAAGAQTFAQAYDNVVANINAAIDQQNAIIDNAEWILAQIAAGVDTKTLEIAKAERALKFAEQDLADAAAQLKVAQARYDAVMAKYVK